MIEEEIVKILELGRQTGVKEGVLEERTRILLELEKVGITAEVWSLIKPIFLTNK